MDSLMQLLLAIDTHGSASQVQQGRQGVAHVSMAVLLLTGQVQSLLDFQTVWFHLFALVVQYVQDVSLPRDRRLS